MEQDKKILRSTFYVQRLRRERRDKGRNDLLPKPYLFEWPLKAFCFINQGETKDQQWELFEPKASFAIAFRVT